MFGKKKLDDIKVDCSVIRKVKKIYEVRVHTLSGNSYDLRVEDQVLQGDMVEIHSGFENLKSLRYIENEELFIHSKNIESYEILHTYEIPIDIMVVRVFDHNSMETILRSFILENITNKTSP